VHRCRLGRHFTLVCGSAGPAETAKVAGMLEAHRHTETVAPAREAIAEPKLPDWQGPTALRATAGGPCTQLAAYCGGTPKFPEGPTDLDAERRGDNRGRVSNRQSAFVEKVSGSRPGCP